MGEIINTGLPSLPSNWTVARFGNCSESIMGHSPKGDTYNFHGEGTPLLNGPAEFNSKFPTAVQWTTSPTRLTQPNDILFCVRGNTAGRMNIADQEYCIGRGLATIRGIQGKTTTDFIFFVLEYLRPRIYALATAGGSTFPNISKSLLLDLGMPKPPLDEQKKIAYVLSTVQRAIAQQEQLIQTTTELKKALMHKLFTEGLHGEKQKETEIGPVPESWDLETVDSLFEMQLGKMLSQKSRTGKSSKLYLRNANVQWGRIDLSDLSIMDFNEQECKRFRLRKGDLLVCEGGEVGRGAIWRGEIDECYYQKALHRLRPKMERISNEFMAYWLMFSFLLKNIYGVTGTRTTIAHLPMIKFKALNVPVPTTLEQEQIVNVLESVDLKIKLASKKRETLQELFRTLLHQLMTAQIRVYDIDLPGFEESILAASSPLD